MLYCTSHMKKGETAGAKAPADIFRIANGYGAKELKFESVKKCQNVHFTRMRALFVGLKNWKNLYKNVEKDSWVILQHPNENIVVANKYIDICKKKKNIHFIALIHDLDSIRKSLILKENILNNRNSLADEVLLKKCDYIICHNLKMKSYLISKGFEQEKILILGIFDYLHNCELPKARKKENRVIVAGNLLRNKCEYLYKLLEKDNLNFKIELFGPNFFVKNMPEFVSYHGVSEAEELPGKLEGTFGLVWDGTEIDRCAGNAGEYIKYNNPHKCSLFLSSNIPVIIWKQAALASFVEENKVGITVDSLLEINEKIENLNDEEYDEMVQNTMKIGEKLRSGNYFTEVLNEIRF